MKQKFTTQFLVISALFAALLCVSAYISIPLPNGTHITFLNFIVMLVALLFSASQSFIIVLLWFLLGALGVPVFIGGNGGVGYLFGQYGGYSFAFLVVAVLLPLLRKKQYNRIYYTVLSIFGAVLVDVIGSVWIMVVGGVGIKAAFVAGFLPFIVLDVVKAVVAAQIVPAFSRIMQTQSHIVSGTANHN